MNIFKDFENIRNEVEKTSPLIHCITNPISINDCANAILAIKGKPIMAEHPLEVEEITKSAKSLCVNIGSMTETSLKSIMLSGKVAKNNNIPSIIDIVGVPCSKLRLDFAKKFISECNPSVIKGNISEIRVISRNSSNAQGVDASKTDIQNISENMKIVKDFAKRMNCVVVATGKTDIISNGDLTFNINNGCEMLPFMTGTGCMLNVIIGTYISTGKILESAILGTSMLGICGELSKTDKGTGTFHINLIDNLYTISNNVITKLINIEYH